MDMILKTMKSNLPTLKKKNQWSFISSEMTKEQQIV